MKVLAAIALGGAIGALGRYLVGQQAVHLLGLGFPWGTFSVNVAGSFLLGTLAETLAPAADETSVLRPLLVVGVLGSFTTFSTFSLDVVMLAQRGRLDLAALYLAGSVGLAVLGLIAGLRLVRAVLG